MRELETNNLVVERIQEDLKGMRHVKGGEYLLFLMKLSFSKIVFINSLEEP